MSDHRLSKIQKNLIAERAVAKGLALADFKWTDERNEYKTAYSALHHVPTGARMDFDEYQSAHWLTWWPNFADVSPGKSFSSWNLVIGVTDKWLAYVAEEQQAPDLWATAQQERAWLTEAPTPHVNSAFTAVERELIAVHLRTIETYVEKTYQLSQEEHERVREQFAYLANAAERLGRFDWRGLAASTLISIVLQLGLTPDRAAGLMNLASHLLGPLMSGAARLLSGS